LFYFGEFLFQVGLGKFLAGKVKKRKKREKKGKKGKIFFWKKRKKNRRKQFLYFGYIFRPSLVKSSPEFE
jgi:hypothetical protein